jgi:hypothetical protein
MKLLYIFIALVLIVGALVFFMVNPFGENIDDNTPVEQPRLPSDVKTPESEKVDTSNFDPASRTITKKELLGTWQSELQDFVGEQYPLDGIILVFTDQGYEKNINGTIQSGIYSLNNNELAFDNSNKKIFINIKNNTLILVYPDWPKAEVYKKI